MPARSHSSSREKEAAGASDRGKPAAAAAVLSFLKEVRAKPTWMDRDLMKSLNITSAEAKQALAVLQLEGYIEPAGSTGKWRTTEQGETVSGAKSPRFTHDSVEQALAALADRIREANAKPESSYTVTQAVAFGDFLRDQPRVQAADVGVQLSPSKGLDDIGSARARSEQHAFLTQLRRGSAMIHIVPFEAWMSDRTHRKLL